MSLTLSKMSPAPTLQTNDESRKELAQGGRESDKYCNKPYILYITYALTVLHIRRHASFEKNIMQHK